MRSRWLLLLLVLSTLCGCSSSSGGGGLLDGAVLAADGGPDGGGPGIVLVDAAPLVDPEDAGVQTWWEFGDSLTYGIGTTPVTGYRFPLWQWTSSHCHVRFIGTGSNGDWPNPVHDGHPGFTIENLTTEARGVYGTHVPSADLVLFMAGTNNMGLLKGVSYDHDKALADYAALLAYLAGENPSGDILVTTIPPIDPVAHPAASANVVDFNAGLPGVWDAFDRARRHVLRADVGRRLSPWSVAHFLAAGNPHPNVAGYAIMADEFEHALAGHASCR